MPRPQTNGHRRLIVVPFFPPDDPRSKIERTPTGKPGFYRVTLVLGVPGKNVFRENANEAEMIKSGDSLLELPKQIVAYIAQIKVGEETISVTLEPNADGRMARVKLRTEASNFEDAQRRGYNLASSFLSYLSFHYAVAIDIVGYEVTEERTDTLLWSMGLIGNSRLATIPESGLTIDNEHRRVLAAYREGLNATNVFCQVLAFYKVIEGIKHLHALQVKEARAQGVEPPKFPLQEFPLSVKQIPDADLFHRGGVPPLPRQEV